MQQTAVFFQQSPRQAYLTLKELRNMVNEKKSQLFMTKICSTHRWKLCIMVQITKDLKSIIAYRGPPTIFFTLSAADMHWPELHQLSSSNINDLNSKERGMNVINNPNLVDWFFTKSVEQFLKS